MYLYEQCLDSSFPLFQLRESFSSSGGLLTWVLSESSVDRIESTANDIDSGSGNNDSTANNTSHPTAVSRFQSAAPPYSPFQSWKSEEALLLLYTNSTVYCWLLQHRPPSSLQESSLSLHPFTLSLQPDSPEADTVFAQMVDNSHVRITQLAGSVLTTMDAVRSDVLRQTTVHSQRIGNECGLTRIVEGPKSDGSYLTMDDHHRLLSWDEHVCSRTSGNL